MGALLKKFDVHGQRQASMTDITLGSWLDAYALPLVTDDASVHACTEPPPDALPPRGPNWRIDAGKAPPQRPLRTRLQGLAPR